MNKNIKPLTAALLTLAAAPAAAQTLAGYEYWIDDRYDQRTEVRTDDGNISIEIDVQGLAPGLHRFMMRAEDSEGRWSPSVVHNFVKPEPPLDGNMITAYEYWFNSGEARRVEVGPANPFTADGMVIEVKDVTPNRIDPDYTVDWAEQTLWTDDDVTFGIRYGDAAGRWSEARTDTFACAVPVSFDTERLAWGDTAHVIQPHPCNVYAYDVEAAEGDSLAWSFSAPCRADIYDGSGNRLARLEAEGKPLEHKMKAGAGGLVTALVYAAGADTLAVCCGRTAASGITPLTEAGMALTAAGGLITLTGAEGGSCTVYGVDGCAVARRSGLGHTETFAVAKGVYVVAVTDRRGKAYRQTVAVD